MPTRISIAPSSNSETIFFLFEAVVEPVRIATFKPLRISIQGEVRNPGTYEFKENFIMSPY